MNTNDIWQLDPSVVYLNHGSLGACPIPVLEAQRIQRQRMESSPIGFLLRDLQPKMREVRRQLAELIGADLDDIALVTNATTAVNTVLTSLQFEPGDEILTTDHEYNACLNSLDVIAERTGVKIVKAIVPFPLESPDQVVAAIVERVTERTRLALVSHVTSATGVIFPVAEIVRALDARGVDVIIDGAHAPALLDLDVTAIGAAYYAATCHKWICSPKGTGLLHVRRDKQAQIRPLVISHGTNDPRAEVSLFRREFDWQGSNDPCGFLAIPVAIETISNIYDGGLIALRTRNHDLALQAQQMLSEVLQVAPGAPAAMTSAMAAAMIDHRFGDERSRTDLDLLLRDRFGIEVPIMWCRLGAEGKQRWLIRVSCQAYNDADDLERLRDALAAAA